MKVIDFVEFFIVGGCIVFIFMVMFYGFVWVCWWIMLRMCELVSFGII